MQDEVVVGITASGLNHKKARRVRVAIQEARRHQTMKNKITIGSRESKLAVLQSEMVRDYINEHNPDLTVEILTMKTTGDKILDRTLDKVGGKGLFVKELDHALLEGRSELSCHSLKDMPWKCRQNFLCWLFPEEKIRGMCWYCRRA